MCLLPRFTSRFSVCFAAGVAAISALVVPSAAQAAGTVQVNFVEPDKFSDAGRGALDLERTTQAFAEHLQALGKRLPDGQSLRLHVTDIDLAGELRPTRHGSEIRVLRGRADWPRVALRYELVQDGRTLKSGATQVADMAYQQTSLSTQRGEAYAYEFRMLERWFKEQIVAAAPTK